MLIIKTVRCGALGVPWCQHMHLVRTRDPIRLRTQSREASGSRLNVIEAVWTP